LKGLRALIVDDNDTNRKVLHHQLARWGVANLAVADGPAALEALRAADTSGNAYDIVLLDMQMPEMDGLMVAEAFGLRILPSATIGLADLDGRPAQLRRASPPRSGCLPDQAGQTFAADPLPGFRHARSAERVQPGSRMRQPDSCACAVGTRAFVAERESVAILIAEDNVVNQKVALLQLKKMDLSADFVGDGGRVACLAPEALQHRVDGLPMPQMDGFEATDSSGRRRPRAKPPGPFRCM